MLEWLGSAASARFFERPIFIVGGSRSGTIILLQAMGRHGQILSTPSEDPFVTDVGRMAYSLEFSSEEDKQYYKETLRIPHSRIYEILRRLILESALGPKYGLKYLVKQSLLHRENVFSKRYWCTKTFPGENTARGLKGLYPEARFIWILRNGTSVVHSRCQFPAFRDLPFADHCQHWARSIARFSYLLDFEDSVIVHQEDLVDDPDREFRRIYTALRIQYDPKPTEYALTHHVHPLAETTTLKGVDIKKTLSERPPAYQNWTPEQLQTFKDICDDAMELAGYKLEF